MTDSVHARINLELGYEWHVPVDLFWSVWDPFEVTFTFRTTPEGREWRISRDLLFLGLEGRAGLGDVRVVRTGAREYQLTLESPSGFGQYVGSVRELASFLWRTEQVVPRGSEQVDVDAWITSLLEAGAA